MELARQIRVAAGARAAAQAAAAEFIQAVRAGLNAHAQAAVALSGGSTPRQLHRLLTLPPYRTALAWNRVHLFWVDERLVPYDDAASNFGAARKDLIEPLQLDRRQVHPIPVAGDAAALAADYETALRHHFGLRGHRPPVFDLICLGMGADGHTASLFPDHPAVDESRRWALAVSGGSPCVDRITLGLPVINNARRVLFLVTGAAKADAVRQVMTMPAAKLPAQRVRPGSGNLIWLLDQAAAGRIPSTAAGK